MWIEFDPAKSAVNLAKHGLPLAMAVELDWNAALVWMDERQDYGEMRMIALAPRTGILYYVAFVDRHDVRRIISLRRANRREAKHYVNTQEEDSDCDSRYHRRSEDHGGSERRS